MMTAHSGKIIWGFVLLAISGCSQEPQNQITLPPDNSPAGVVERYWQAQSGGQYAVATTYALPGELANWRRAVQFEVMTVGDAEAHENVMVVPVQIKTQHGDEETIQTVLTLQGDEYWVDVEATIARTWRPETVLLEKELRKPEGYVPDVDDPIDPDQAQRGDEKTESPYSVPGD